MLAGTSTPTWQLQRPVSSGLLVRLQVATAVIRTPQTERRETRRRRWKWKLNARYRYAQAQRRGVCALPCCVQQLERSTASAVRDETASSPPPPCCRALHDS